MCRKTPLLGLLLLVLAGCATAIPGEPDTAPIGFTLPRGPVFDVRAGDRRTIIVPLGALVEVAEDPDYARPDLSVLALARRQGGELIYQAIAPGLTVVQDGPVGHPCRESGGSDCGSDATPPPAVFVTVNPPDGGTGSAGN